jgi:hypothetical protein
MIHSRAYTELYHVCEDIFGVSTMIECVMPNAPESKNWGGLEGRRRRIMCIEIRVSRRLRDRPRWGEDEKARGEAPGL